MSASAPAPIAASAPLREAVYIGDRFAWIHRPAAPPAIGLVIVPPFGYEAICAHRALRHLGERAAAAGLVAIRIDPDGTGDSAGDDLDRGRLEAWVASIVDACDVARAEGADRVVIAGVRLGGILAALAAARRTDCAGLAAIATVPAGKTLLRELKALQMALDLAAPPRAVTTDADEAVGFAISGETRSALSQVDLAKLAAPPAPSVLLVDRDDLPGNDRWAKHLGELGVDVVQLRRPGYVDMVLDPHKAKIPDAILDAVIDYATSRPALDRSRPAAHVATRDALALDGVTEHPVWLDRELFGIATRPCGTASSRRAVLLLNAGAIGRVGPNRLYVALARRLASTGDLVLRFDLSGIADSLPRPGATENVVYSDQALCDIATAVAWARAQGATRVACVGLCSGAYHALKAAVAGQRIDSVVAINPLTFFYKPGMPLDAQAFRVTQEAARYTQDAMWSAASWKKLVRGKVDVRRVAAIIGRRVRAAVEHRARDVLRKLRVPLTDDLGSELAALDRRGVAIDFIFAAGDPGHAMLHEHGGSVVDALIEKHAMHVEVIDGPDHTFTPRWSHPLVLDAITRAVQR